MNNDVYYRGELIGFRCSRCGCTYSSMWGTLCNLCRDRVLTYLLHPFYMNIQLRLFIRIFVPMKTLAYALLLLSMAGCSRRPETPPEPKLSPLRGIWTQRDTTWYHSDTDLVERSGQIMTLDFSRYGDSCTFEMYERIEGSNNYFPFGTTTLAPIYAGDSIFLPICHIRMISTGDTLRGWYRNDDSVHMYHDAFPVLFTH